jgi:hypothetical protein
MRFAKKKLPALLISLLPMVFATGCVVYARPVAPVVAVEPGYYYDEAYVDVYGVYHPRVFYYYHGGVWDRRPYAPGGFVVRPRVYRR